MQLVPTMQGTARRTHTIVCRAHTLLLHLLFIPTLYLVLRTAGYREICRNTRRARQAMSNTAVTRVNVSTRLTRFWNHVLLRSDNYDTSCQPYEPRTCRDLDI